ncbi:MAG: membrane-associated phospholipid [Bacteroidetes bacterium]|nr:MAG: membrane-associated phospholipid [Bacteroidota bacterium]
MTNIIKNNPVFFSFIGIYWLFLGVLLLVTGYEGSFLLLNAMHHPLLDYPMFLLTHLGDALILTPFLALLLARKNPALVLYIIAIVIITGLFGQFLKNVIFDECDRPLKIFDGIAHVHTVAGYRLFHNSFPSGHSLVAAAALTACFSGIVMNKIWQTLTAIAVILISYTRTYVGVHFPGDVLAGTIIGVLGATLLTKPLYLPLLKWTNNFSVKKRKRTISILLAISGISVIAGIYLIYSSIQ